MRIIAAWDLNTNEILDDDTIKKDVPKLRKKHAEAMKKEATWSSFGGVLTIKDRRYQVVEE